MDNGNYMAAFHVTLLPGWKTYWRAPGDAGIPPSFNWSAASNIGGIRFHWPTPEVSYLNGMRSVGYAGELVLPVEITAADPSRPVRLAGEVNIGVCETVCIPMTLQFDAELSRQGTRDAVIVAALLDRPRTAAEAGVGAVSCAVSPIEGGLSLTARVTMSPMGGAEEAVIESGIPGTWVSEPSLVRQGNVLQATSRIYAPDRSPLALDRSRVRITVLGASGAVDIQGCARG